MSFEDFNTLPDFISEQILSHLNICELKNAFLVSKKWHNYISSNRICMERLRLRIEGWQDLEIVSSILENNSRMHSSITLYNINPEKNFTYLKTQNWKNVRLQQMKFLSQSSFYQYLLQFGEELETLKIEKIIIDKEECLEEKLNLPKLRKLKLKQVPTLAFAVFSGYATLKSLDFDIPAFGRLSRNIIITFFNQFMHKNVESLSIRRNSLYGLTMSEVDSVELVIASMVESLKKLELKDWGCSHSFQRLWNRLNVEQFSIHFGSTTPTIAHMRDLEPKINLKVLELSFPQVLPALWCKLLFLLTPSLEHIFITKIRKEIVYYAANILHNLKSFKYASCVIDIAFTEFYTTDEDDIETVEMSDDEELPTGYNYIANNELFDLQGTQPRPLIIQRYSDSMLEESFASNYYINLKKFTFINPLLNTNIDFRKCDKK